MFCIFQLCTYGNIEQAINYTHLELDVITADHRSLEVENESWENLVDAGHDHDLAGPPVHLHAVVGEHHLATQFGLAMKETIAVCQQ